MNVDQDVLARVDDFFADSKVSRFTKGQNILRPEDTPNGVYYLKTGFVRQYLVSPSGEVFIVHIYKPGSFFPLSWIVNDTPNMFHFEAMTSVVIAQSSKDRFVKFIQSTPEVLYFATQKLAAGMHGLVNRVGQLVLDDAFTKTVLLLLYFADTFGEKTPEGVVISVPVPHREIASWIGTTRETASLQIEGLIKKGLIKVHGRLIVLADIAALRKVASH